MTRKASTKIAYTTTAARMGAARGHGVFQEAAAEKTANSPWQAQAATAMMAEATKGLTKTLVYRGRAGGPSA